MGIKVRSSTIVPPITGTPKMVIWNSNVDLVVHRFHFETIYFYSPNPRSDFFAPEIMREAIGKALVPFHPMGGRLMKDEIGRIAINSDGQGVLFVEAETDLKLEDLGDFAPQPALLDLTPKIDSKDDITSYPLLLLQVTRFKCGGVSFGLAMHHQAADAMSGMQFINSISSFARGAEVDVTPFLDRTILKARTPPRPAFEHVEYQPQPALLSEAGTNSVVNGHAVVADAVKEKVLTPEKEDDSAIPPKTSETPADEVPVAMAVFVFPKEKLAVLKKKGSHADNPKPYSSYEMLSGHIWKSMILARKLTGPQPTKFYTAVEARSRLVPRLPKDYFGNVVFRCTPVSTAEEITSNPIYHAAGLIQSAVAQMEDDYLRSAIDYLEQQPDLTSISRAAFAFKSPNLSIVSWGRLPLYACDFGWGKPLYVTPAAVQDGQVFVLPSPVNDGSFTVSIGLRADSIDKFKALILDVEAAE